MVLACCLWVLRSFRVVWCICKSKKLINLELKRIGIVADINDDVCYKAVTIRCALVWTLISLAVLPERYGIPIAVVPERFGVAKRM